MRKVADPNCKICGGKGYVEVRYSDIMAPATPDNVKVVREPCSCRKYGIDPYIPRPKQ